ncbi:hypothetical protein [Amycolatopsis orientalis]|uniref:hypothetical protein n=1 Tax=Amycolatopsis orientalis TaxID=31958 RepID=UPI001319F682|nr:hypothetical protein [Amycolatopsis orientalis]
MRGAGSAAAVLTGRFAVWRPEIGTFAVPRVMGRFVVWRLKIATFVGLRPGTFAVPLGKISPRWGTTGSSVGWGAVVVRTPRAGTAARL